MKTSQILNWFLVVVLGGIAIWIYSKFFSKSEEEKAKDTADTNIQQMETMTNNESFNPFDPSAVSMLRGRGFGVMLFTEETAKYVDDQLRWSGYIVTRDDQVLNAVRMFHYRTQVSQIAKLMQENAINMIGQYTDLKEFLKDGLSEENYNWVINYIAKLPSGIIKK